MQWHITNCAFIPKNAISDYYANNQVQIASRGKATGSSAVSTRKLLGPVMTKKQQIEH